MRYVIELVVTALALAYHLRRIKVLNARCILLYLEGHRGEWCGVYAVSMAAGVSVSTARRLLISLSHQAPVSFRVNPLAATEYQMEARLRELPRDDVR